MLGGDLWLRGRSQRGRSQWTTYFLLYCEKTSPAVTVLSGCHVIGWLVICINKQMNVSLIHSEKKSSNWEINYGVFDTSSILVTWPLALRDLEQLGMTCSDSEERLSATWYDLEWLVRDFFTFPAVGLAAVATVVRAQGQRVSVHLPVDVELLL